MKRVIVIVLAFAMILSCFGFSVSATQPETSDSLSEAETEELRNRLIANGYSTTQLTTDVLYDSNGDASYMLAVTGSSYMILERASYRFNESGGGNPYADYMDEIKYYGGPICYYIENPDLTDQSNPYFDISMRKPCASIGVVQWREDSDVWNTPFGDVSKNDWFCEDVTYVSKHGLMNGTKEATFAPSALLSRAMAVTMLYRLAGEPDAKDLQMPYDDVPEGKWYTDAVKWSYACMILGGTSPDEFSPNRSITREQFAAALYRYSNYYGCDTTARARLMRYPDSGSVSADGQEAMSWAVAEGMIQGVYSNDVCILAPQRIATRAQAAAMIRRYCRNYCQD